MKISVIIPTYNRADHLNMCLKSLNEQTFSNDLFEVIVIDNNSTDETELICKSYMNKIKNFKYFIEKKQGLHSGRHRGMNEAENEILVFADDDIRAFPTWLEGIHESFEDQMVALVGGKNLPDWEDSPPDWILKMWNCECNFGNALGYLSILDFGNVIREIGPEYVWGCNFSIRKSVLINAGGFHPDSFPQNMIQFRGDGETYISDYVSFRGYKTIYNPKASVFHLVTKNRMTFEYFKKRAFNQGISNSFTEIRNSKKVKINMIKKLKHLINKELYNQEDWDLDRLLSFSCEDGYLWHQKKVKSDENLYNWVMKENYLNV